MLLALLIQSQSITFTGLYTNFTKLVPRADYLFSKCYFQKIGNLSSDSPVWIDSFMSSNTIKFSECFFSNCAAKQGGTIMIHGYFKMNIEKICAFMCTAIYSSSIYVDLSGNNNISYFSATSCISDYKNMFLSGVQSLSNVNMTQSTTNTNSNEGIIYFQTSYPIEYYYCILTNNSCPCSIVIHYKCYKEYSLHHSAFFYNTVTDYGLIRSVRCYSNGKVHDIILQDNELNGHQYFEAERCDILLMNNIYVDINNFSGITTQDEIIITSNMNMPKYEFYQTGGCLMFTNNPTPIYNPINTPINTIAITPYKTVELTPASTQSETAFNTPYYTLLLTQFPTHSETFSETVFQTIVETPINTNFETIMQTNQATPFQTIAETPLSTLSVTMFYTAVETPFQTNANTPFNTQFKTPFISFNQTPLQTLIETLLVTPSFSVYETPLETNNETPHTTNYMTPQYTFMHTNKETNDFTSFITPYNSLSGNPNITTNYVPPSKDYTYSQFSSSNNTQNHNTTQTESSDDGETTKMKILTPIFIIIISVSAFILIILIVGLMIIFNRKKENESTSKSCIYDNTSVEETVVTCSTPNPNITIDNPLFTTSLVDETDPFHNDFAEIEGDDIDIFRL